MRLLIHYKTKQPLNHLILLEEEDNTNKEGEKENIIKYRKKVATKQNHGYVG